MGILDTEIVEPGTPEGRKRLEQILRANLDPGVQTYLRQLVRQALEKGGTVQFTYETEGTGSNRHVIKGSVRASYVSPHDSSLEERLDIDQPEEEIKITVTRQIAQPDIDEYARLLYMLARLEEGDDLKNILDRRNRKDRRKSYGTDKGESISKRTRRWFEENPPSRGRGYDNDITGGGGNGQGSFSTRAYAGKKPHNSLTPEDLAGIDAFYNRSKEKKQDLEPEVPAEKKGAQKKTSTPVPKERPAQETYHEAPLQPAPASIIDRLPKRSPASTYEEPEPEYEMIYEEPAEGGISLGQILGAAFFVGLSIGLYTLFNGLLTGEIRYEPKPTHPPDTATPPPTQTPIPTPTNTPQPGLWERLFPPDRVFTNMDECLSVFNIPQDGTYYLHADSWGLNSGMTITQAKDHMFNIYNGWPPERYKIIQDIWGTMLTNPDRYPSPDTVTLKQLEGDQYKELMQSMCTFKHKELPTPVPQPTTTGFLDSVLGLHMKGAAYSALMFTPLGTVLYLANEARNIPLVNMVYAKAGDKLAGLAHDIRNAYHSLKKNRLGFKQAK